MNVLVVTNDFPPRAGGIQQYTHNLTSRLAGDRVTVYAPAWPGAAAFDRTIEANVVRHPTARIMPTPAVGERVRALVRAERADVVVFAAAFPLGLLGAGVTGATGVPCVGFTHGVEVGLGAAPAVRRVMRRIAAGLRLLTAVSTWSLRRLTAVVEDRCRVELLVSGVALDRYHPGLDGAAVRARFGLEDSPVCVCVSRLTPRKGQDRLIQAWPEVAERVSGARLLLVGGGPDAARLRHMAASGPVHSQIVFAGELPWDDVPGSYAAGNVFAMPCRTRWAGLDVEALGAVFLEAAACGLPAVAGRSGGAPETLVDGVTGRVVDGRRPRAVADAIAPLLAEPERARAMGSAGRRRVAADFGYPVVAARLQHLLAQVVKA